MNEADIIEGKRFYSAPDKSRRVLLAIDRIESNVHLQESALNKEISKIRTSIRNICNSLNDEDSGFFVMSINDKYCPQDRNILYIIERYKLLARGRHIALFCSEYRKTKD